MNQQGVQAGLGVVTAAVFVVAVAAPAQAEPPWRAPWAVGSRSYRYEATEADAGAAPATGQRIDFRLLTDAHGGMLADIVSAQVLSGGAWKPLAVTADCRHALHARLGELAEIRLQPLAPAALNLGDAFMASCAPDDLFTPMTDILNVVLIIGADQFHARDLSRVGQTVSFPGLSTSVSRGDLAMSESSDTGEVTLLALEDETATLDWKPSVSTLDMTKGAGDQRLPMSGTEHFAFRVVLERRTGLLDRAETLFDDVDLKMGIPNMPADRAPHVKIRRAVSITSLHL